MEKMALLAAAPTPEGRELRDLVVSAFKKVASIVSPFAPPKEAQFDGPLAKHFLAISVPVLMSKDLKDLNCRLDEAIFKLRDIDDDVPPPTHKEMLEVASMDPSVVLSSEGGLFDVANQTIARNLRESVASGLWFLRAGITDSKAWPVLNVTPWSLYDETPVVPSEVAALVVSGFHGFVALFTLTGAMVYAKNAEPWLLLKLSEIARDGLADYVRLIASASDVIPARVVPLVERLDLGRLQVEAEEADRAIVETQRELVRRELAS